MGSTVPDERVAAVRAFNRGYTQFLGVLQEHLLDTRFSLTEARVLFELAADGTGSTEVVTLRRALDLDAGYLSRVLARFEEDGLLRRQRSDTDGRRQVVRLTDHGRGMFATLDQRSSEQVRGLLAGMTEEDQRRLVDAMGVIRRQLDGVEQGAEAPAVRLREPAAGEYGWVVQRNGALYAQEQGFDAEYEANVAKIVADYLFEHDPRRERAWIAELGGERVGAIFCVRKDDCTAKLRLLHVEPRARGAGVGTTLVSECVGFARDAGYSAVELWTVSVLAPARRIYQRAGFHLVAENPKRLFGQDLVGQTWRLELG